MKTTLLFAALIAAAAAACGDNATTAPAGSPLAGLNRAGSNDTSVRTPPTGTGSSYFHGTVMAQSAPGAGNDSLVTAPRVAGVVVTLYTRTTGPADEIAAGEKIASVTTGTDGLF